MPIFPPKPNPKETLAKLKAGNTRFAAGQSVAPRFDADYRMMLAEGKRSDHVLATVVGCSDSRVCPEFVFNSDPGDLFVIRTAGFACLSDESLASANFGVVHLKSPLLIVLGHTDCKAVKIAVHKTEADAPDPNLPLETTLLTLGDSLKESLSEMGIRKIGISKRGTKEETLTSEALDEIIKKNVFLTIERIRQSSPEIQKLQAEGEVIIAPALYRLESGLVEWL